MVELLRPARLTSIWSIPRMNHISAIFAWNFVLLTSGWRQRTKLADETARQLISLPIHYNHLHHHPLSVHLFSYSLLVWTTNFFHFPLPAAECCYEIIFPDAFYCSFIFHLRERRTPTCCTMTYRNFTAQKFRKKNYNT